jgi:hypothetical protein
VCEPNRESDEPPHRNCLCRRSRCHDSRDRRRRRQQLRARPAGTSERDAALDQWRSGRGEHSDGIDGDVERQVSQVRLSVAALRLERSELWRHRRRGRLELHAPARRCRRDAPCLSRCNQPKRLCRLNFGCESASGHGADCSCPASSSSSSSSSSSGCDASVRDIGPDDQRNRAAGADVELLDRYLERNDPVDLCVSVAAMQFEWRLMRTRRRRSQQQLRPRFR